MVVTVPKFTKEHGGIVLAMGQISTDSIMADLTNLSPMESAG